MVLRARWVPDGSTANDAYRCLRAIVNTAERTAGSAIPPARSRAPARLKPRAPRGRPGRVDAAVAAIATRYKAGYAIAAWCQLRRGEILACDAWTSTSSGNSYGRLNWVMPPGATRPRYRNPGVKQASARSPSLRTSCPDRGAPGALRRTGADGMAVRH